MRRRDLRVLCGLLGSAYTPAGSAPRIGGGVDWPAVARLAAEHLVAGGLWSSAVANGLTIPEPYRAALAWEHRRNRLDASRRVAQVLAIVGCLNHAGIEPLLIKGAAQLLEGTFADPGERAMHDLDVVVWRGELDAALRALADRGYLPEPEPAKPSGHELVLGAPDRGAPLDLHFELGEPPLTAVLPTAEARGAALSREREGVRYSVLTPTHAVVHNAAHAQLQDLDYAVAAIPVRPLHAFAALTARWGDAVDWAEAAGRFARAGRTPAWIAHADLTRTFFGVSAPVPPNRRAALHRARCLATAAVPGLGDLQRNLRFAFEPDYLRHRYGEAPWPVLGARHAATLWRRQGRRVLDDALTPRGR